MRLRRLQAIAVKEFLQIWRDPRSLMIALLLPFTQMFLLGYGVTLDLKHIPVCTFDREASQASQALLKKFQASMYFEITRNVRTYPQLVDAIDRSDCKIAVVIPPDFSQRLNDAGRASVQLILDATDDNTATIALGYAQAVVGAYSGAVQLERTQSLGQPPPVVPAVAQYRVWFNEDLVSRNYIMPGVVALVMALVGAQLTSLTISREWERGTMEILVSTPVTRMELMAGKILPYFVIGLADAALCLGIAVIWFEAPFRGAVSTLFLTTSLFLVVVLGLGYFISASIRSQVGASQIALVATLLPTTLLSGFAFPIEQMPTPIQWLTYLVPARYYFAILKSIFLKGSGLGDLLAPVGLLALYAAIVGLLAARAFRKTLD